MWKCHKCGKPVYFAERKQSLGYDWHPECLRCEECGKRLNPGQHAEHKGVPYCHVPCYGALFGPQLFGHGTRVESHKNFGQKGIQRVNGGAPALPRDHLDSKLKLYNQFYDNKSLEVRSREVNNRLILEGALRVYWGVQGVIHLKEDDDQRTVAVRKRNSGRYSTSAIEQDNSDKENEIDASESIEPPTTTTTTGLIDDFSTDISLSESMTFDSCSLNEYPLSEEATTPTTPTATQSTTTTNTGSTSSTLPSKLDNLNSLEWDEIDDLLQVERRFNEKDKIYETMPVKLPSSQSSSDSSPTKSASEKSSSTTTETSSDNFITASASIGTTTATTTTTSATNNETTDDDETLKPMDFEDFKRSIHQEYVNGTNDFLNINDDTLKKNQPIDPSRINDSLKLYGENAMSKSFNCEQALRTIDPAMINDTLCRRVVSGVEHSSARNYALQKSGSASSNHYHGKSLFEKGINRSKSGPTCFDFTDSEEESSTLKQSKPVTIRRSQPRYINIRMDCYPNQSDNDTSASKAVDTNSFSAAGELTTTETYVNGQHLHVTEDGVVLRRPPKTGSTAIKRRSGNKRSRTKLKRRCSINGHFYNRETSFFTPPYGSQMSVWVTSLVTTQEVINLVLEKYKVDSPAENFSLFIVRDNGEQKRLKELDYPLVVRIMLGPHEDVARLFLMDAQKTQEISNEVAQFINLSIPECRAILDRYDDELDREIAKVREKYAELRRRITSRMESLKVRL